MRQIKTKEWGVPVPKELENNPYFYRHHLTHKVFVVPDLEQANKHDMLDLYFESQTLVKTEFFQYSSAKNVEDVYFNDLKKAASTVSATMANNNNVPAITHEADKDHPPMAVTATKEATAANVQALGRIPRRPAPTTPVLEAPDPAGAEEEDIYPPEQTLSRQSSKDMFSDPEAHDDDQEVDHDPAGVLGGHRHATQADHDQEDEESKSEGEVSSSQQSLDDDIKAKVQGRNEALSAFGQDDGSSSSGSEKSSGSDEDDDFQDDPLYAKTKRSTKASSRSLKDEFMSAGAVSTFDKVKSKSYAHSEPDVTKVAKSKPKVATKHKKIVKTEPAVKTYTQSILPTVKLGPPKPKEVIEVLSSPSEKEAEKPKAKQKTVDDFNAKLAKKLAKAKEQEKDLVSDLGSEPAPVVSTPAPPNAEEAAEKPKKTEKSRKRKTKDTFVTAPLVTGKRSTRNSRQTGPVTEAISEPPVKKSKATRVSKKGAKNNMVVGEIDVVRTHSGTPVVAKAPIPVQLENNFTQQLSPITEHDVNEVRDEILAEVDGHNVDGDYAALPDFV